MKRSIYTVMKQFEKHMKTLKHISSFIIMRDFINHLKTENRQKYILQIVRKELSKI